jgi:hypothetical protein
MQHLQKTRRVGCLLCSEPLAALILLLRSSPFLSYSCALFGTAQKSTPLFSSASELFAQKHPGWGYLKLFNRSSIAVVGRTFPSVPLRRKAFDATICKGTGFLHHPGKQLRSPRCLRLRERTSGTVHRRSRSQVVPGSGVLTRVSGFVLTNPEQVKRTEQQGGSSTHLIKDAGRTRAGKAGSVRLG